jgi:hypothetical protein
VNIIKNYRAGISCGYSGNEFWLRSTECSIFGVKFLDIKTTGAYVVNILIVLKLGRDFRKKNATALLLVVVDIYSIIDSV